MGLTSTTDSKSGRLAKRRLLFPLLATLLLSGGACERRPDKVLSDSEMEKFMTDMMLADAYEQSAPGRSMPDSVRHHLGESVMKAHGIDYETLDSTYAWYARNLDDYYKLYSKVEKRLEKQRSRIEGNARLPETEMQNDIWHLPRHIAFSPLGEGDALVFELPGEAMEKGERLEWKMRLSRSGEGNLTLGVDYEDGSVAVAERDFRSDRNPTLKLVSDTGKMVRRIYGVLSVPRNAMPVYTDSIVLLRLPFDSTEYRNTWAQKRYNAPNQRVAPALKADSVASDTAAIDSVKESK
ncbi:MAG: DUF4296 domain-containing protein [Bacteroides sp.]|nr:DUF4296 domain-containing protein [Bacteroides sp.]